MTPSATELQCFILHLITVHNLALHCFALYSFALHSCVYNTLIYITLSYIAVVYIALLRYEIAARWTSWLDIASSDCLFVRVERVARAALEHLLLEGPSEDPQSISTPWKAKEAALP